LGFNVSKKQSLKSQIEEIKAGWQRTAADFENYKKRVEAEKKSWGDEAKIEAAEKILPIADNFSLAVSHLPQENKDSQWVQGIILIAKQIETVLQELGAEKISVEKGAQFNPLLHEARQTKKVKNASPGTIVKIEKPGYKLADKIIRPARVIVAR